MIEAGASARPVVATLTTGMNEIIDDGVSGFIVPIEDPASLTAALLKLVDDAALRARMGGALKRVVDERFLISSYVRNLEAAYAGLLTIPSAELGWGASRWRGDFGMYGGWALDTLRRQVARAAGQASVAPEAQA